MSEELRLALVLSPFGTLEEVKRFKDWFEEDNQIHSDWDKNRYVWCKLLTILSIKCGVGLIEGNN